MTDRRLSTPVSVQPFFTTEQQHITLARERFFEEGDRPSGRVGEGVIQSWSRCMQACWETLAVAIAGPRHRMEGNLAECAQLLVATCSVLSRQQARG